MSRILDHRIFLLVLSFLTSLRSTKVLSEWKKCGDWECETAMSRVQATTDYLGPDCRYLSFKTGEEIIVYSKLSRKNENLWIGSKGKDFGYFPKDAVKVEEVLIAEEVEVLTKETDFLCLDGDEYGFENEDSALDYQNKESEYSSSDAESELQENELLNHAGNSIQKEETIESGFENGSKESESQESASKKLVSEKENRNEDAEQPELQNSLPLEPIPTQTSWVVSNLAGWFATGSENDEETLKAVTEPSEENSYQGRKIAVTADNDLEEPNDQEEQDPTGSGWLQSGLKDFLYFGKESENVGLVSENDVEIHDVSSVDAHSYSEHETAVTELSTEKEQNSESQGSTSNWFSLGLSDVLNFGQAEKNAVAMEDHESKEGGDEASKNEEIRTFNQQESHTDKESNETVKEVLGEADENYAQEVIDSDSNTPSAREITASVYTLNDTKNISSSTGSSFDKLTGDKEDPVDPCSSEQDVVSVSQLLKNTEDKERDPELERNYGQTGVGSKRRLLEEKPEDKYEMDAPTDSEQHSEEIGIPSVNSEEKMPSLVADFQHDDERSFSDDIFQIQNYIPDNELLAATAASSQRLTAAPVRSVFTSQAGVPKAQPPAAPHASLRLGRAAPHGGESRHLLSLGTGHKCDGRPASLAGQGLSLVPARPLALLFVYGAAVTRRQMETAEVGLPAECNEGRSSFVAGERTSVSEELLLRAPAVHEGGLPGSPGRLPAAAVPRCRPGRAPRLRARCCRPALRCSGISLFAAAAPPLHVSVVRPAALPPYCRQQWYGRLLSEGPEGGRAWPCRRRGKMAAGGRGDASGAATADLWLGLRDAAQRCCRWAAEAVRRAVASLPEDMRPGPDLDGFPWELVIAVGIVGAFTIFLFLYRSYQSVRSRLYVGREKQLANKIAELVEEKCKILEKLSLSKKELEDLELSLKDDSVMKESDASLFEETHEKLNKSNLELNQEIENLEKELEGEKSKQSENDKLVAEIQERLESLEKEAKSIQSQVAEAKSTLKVYQINTERLQTSLQDAIEENRQLQESEKQLLQEAEGWGERFSELNEQTKMFESSKADIEEVLKDKESQVKSLTQYLLKMKDWSSAVRDDDDTEDNQWDIDLKGETENGEHLDDQQKRTIKKLIYAAKLNACLKTMETERDQMYSKLSDESKAKGELTERIENLQSEQVSLQSENERLESEVQKLQQKLKVMTELYQENEMKLHRKLTVEERERLQKEEKLSKVDEKITHAAEELNSYRQRAKDLEEELERTIRSYQNQITSHEKKAHDNWLTARAAERQLNDIRKENAHNRQKLTEAEFKLDLLEKDPYALDVPVRPFREHSPYGPSPMGRPSSETRAFLSPPTLLEGPLRLSPMLPGAGGGRGSRGPGSTVMYEASNERGDMSSDRLTDPHRPPSDTGSLSPPWDRERRIILPPSGEPYTDSVLPPRRQERFFPNPPNTGRLSGPAELRTYNMQSFEKIDGQTSSENSPLTEPTGNEMKDHSNLSNSLPDQLLASESEAVSSGFGPPPFPPVRPPTMPMDPRGPFMRRPPFPPPPPAGIYGPRECFPVRDLGLPRPPLPKLVQYDSQGLPDQIAHQTKASGGGSSSSPVADTNWLLPQAWHQISVEEMRNPFPMRSFPHYPPQRPEFLPPPPPPENRIESPQSNTSATEQPEPQQET